MANEPVGSVIPARFFNKLLDDTGAARIQITKNRDIDDKWEILAFDRNYHQYKREGDTLDEAASKIVEAMTKHE